MSSAKTHDLNRMIAISKNLRDVQYTLDRLAEEGDFAVPELNKLTAAVAEAQRFARLASVKIKDRPGACRRLRVVR